MTKIKLIICVIVVAGIATILVIQHQAQVKLHEENESLRQQMDQLQIENQRLSNSVAQANSSSSRPDDQLTELLRLRGEVRLLRQQTNELGRLQQDSQQLRNQVLAGHRESVQLPTQGQFEWHQTNTINAARLVLLGMLIFSGDNHDLFPTNFSQISAYTEGMTNQTSGIGAEAFEFLEAGLTANNQNANRTILRERIPFRTADGKWARIYGFGDGHVEEQVSEDGNFGAFEQQHMVRPLNQ